MVPLSRAVMFLISRTMFWKCLRNYRHYTVSSDECGGTTKVYSQHYQSLFAKRTRVVECLGKYSPEAERVLAVFPVFWQIAPQFSYQMCSY